MNNTEFSGEQSCNRREDGDAPTGSERPLKKARFAWQVKGKYRLKTENNESNQNPTLPSEISSELSTKSNSSVGVGSEMEEFFINHDYSQLDSVIDRDNSLLTPKTAMTRGHEPKYISSYERSLGFTPEYSKILSNVNYTEDQCIANWQTLQWLQGNFDNTLNEFSDRLSKVYVTVEGTSYFHRIAEFVNHYPDTNSVENEGILMAISAHGLQNTQNSNNIQNMDENETSRFPGLNFPTSLHSSSPSPSNEGNHQQEDRETISTANVQPLQESKENKEPSDATTPIANFSDLSHSPENSNIDTDWETEFDFMNAAIMNAIKNKGLTLSEAKYG